VHIKFHVHHHFLILFGTNQRTMAKLLCINLCPVVLDLNNVDRQMYRWTQAPIFILTSCTLCI